MTLPTSLRAKDGGKIPGPAAVPLCVEIAVWYSAGGSKTFRNVFHGSYTGSPPALQTLANNLFTSLGTAWSSNLASHMATSTNFVRVEVRDMQSALNPIFVGTGTAIPGTGTGDELPLEVAAVLTENIVARGRGAKGRVYIGGWDETANGAIGQMAGAVQTAINAYGTAVFNAITSGGLVPCVAKVARQQYIGLTGTTHPSRSATTVAVGSYTCRDLNWDSQRRRGNK
jgi:hypothetical protein